MKVSVVDCFISDMRQLVFANFSQAGKVCGANQGTSNLFLSSSCFGKNQSLCFHNNMKVSVVDCFVYNMRQLVFANFCQAGKICGTNQGTGNLF